MSLADLNTEPQTLQRYYKWHAPFYDATRWSFLFGRKQLIEQIPNLPSNPAILEVGCGTGYNLQMLQQRFPHSHVTGLDLSSRMLDRSSEKPCGENFRLIQGRYGMDYISESFDLILLSYSLTMMRIPLREVISRLQSDLKEGGVVAVVDFHRTRFCWFRRWMEKNHVQMNGVLLPALYKSFNDVHYSAHPAYWGLWSYFLFVGR